MIPKQDARNWLLLKRHVRFGDSDAAGVIHFHNLFRWAHESWEESLESYGLSIQNIFPGCSFKANDSLNIALPVINCSANFIKPIQTGQILQVKLEPVKIDSSSFKVKTNFFRDEDRVAFVAINHVAINSINRRRCSLPESLIIWLDASSSEK